MRQGGGVKGETAGTTLVLLRFNRSPAMVCHRGFFPKIFVAYLILFVTFAHSRFREKPRLEKEFQPKPLSCGYE